MTFAKGDRVGIRSRGLEQVAAFGLMRRGTVSRLLPGGEFVEIALDEPGDKVWGGVMVPVGRVERIEG